MNGSRFRNNGFKNDFWNWKVFKLNFFFQPLDPTTLDVICHVLRPSSDAVMTNSHRLMDLLKKVVVSTPSSVVVQTTLLQLKDRNWKDVVANMDRLVVVRTTRLRPEDLISKDVVVCTRNSPVVQTVTLQLLDQITKDADAILSNSVAALTSSPWLKDLIWKDADAKIRLTDVVKMNELQLTDRNLKVVLANPVNMVAVWTELPPLRDRTTKVARKNPHFLAVKFKFNPFIYNFFQINIDINYSCLRTGQGSWLLPQFHSQMVLRYGIRWMLSFLVRRMRWK